MYTILKEFTFAAAHAIRGHTRGCQNLHGHNYQVRVFLAAEELDELGMVMDFADLKAVMAEVLNPFDHAVINEVPPFDRVNTSAELISGYVYEQVKERLAQRSEGERVRVVRVEVWENPRSCAIYEPATD